MLNLLVKPLLGVVADGVKGFVETKKAKQELDDKKIQQGYDIADLRANVARERANATKQEG